MNNLTITLNDRKRTINFAGKPTEGRILGEIRRLFDIEPEKPGKEKPGYFTCIQN